MAEREGEGGAELPPILDARQLVRIEAVHRGFFYQHLYAVSLLLQMQGDAHGSVAVERDEDVELRRDGETLYVQVKTRAATLQPHDITGALERFVELRKAHADGERAGAAKFAIVTNVEPSPGLTKQLGDAAWPDDVELVSPARPSASGLPAPGADVPRQLAATEAAAAAVPFGGLSPATLVMKLASIVQLRAAGAGGHIILSDELVPMLEQIVAQLQDFPEPPRPYYPQRDEPPILSDARFRLIVGFSGAGKTAWASEAARHRGEPIAYFDAGGLPSASIASNLARELVARFAGAPGEAARLPPGIGLDLLRAADALLLQQGVRPLVVIDNAHELSAADLRRVVDAAPNTAFLALARPWPDRALIEAELGIVAEQLEGYDVDTVAAIFSAEGAAIDVEEGLGILALTGGLPLYVANAARLASSHHGGDASALVAAIREQTLAVDTAQALILERSFAALSDRARDAAGWLGMCDVPISDEEAMAFLGDLGEPGQRAAALRELRRASMIVATPGGLSLHDALRPLAAAHASGFAADRVTGALIILHLMLMQSLSRASNIPRLTFMVRLLPRVGQTDALVDLATSEMFYEQGNHAILFDTLTAAAEDETASPRDRFWAMDAVAYWQSRDGGDPDRDIVARMVALVDAHPEFEDRERLNLIFKQLVLAGSDGDRKAIDRLSEAARRLVKGKDEESRLFRYNRAVALYRAGALDAVRTTLEPLIDDLFKLLGFPEHRLVGANGPGLLALLEGVEDVDDIKRTADALSLWCAVVTRSGHAPGLRRIQAAKLFYSTRAARSAVTTAMEAADDFLTFMGDAMVARQTIEQHVLPVVHEFGLTDMTLSARGQYAVVLAWRGDFEAADREVALLRNFGGEPERRAEFARQAELIEDIRSGREILTPLPNQQLGLHLVRQPNLIGRGTRDDAPCPCGSGRKYKRCHGQRR